MRAKDMTLIAVTAALICIAGPLTIAAGPVPLSLAQMHRERKPPSGPLLTARQAA